MELKKELKELKDFDGFEVSLYRSYLFELLFFEFNQKIKHRIFLKYPDTDYFVELYGNGGWSFGKKECLRVGNVWDDNDQISVKLFESNLFLDLNDFHFGFDFMTLVGKYSEKNNGYVSNLEEINQVFSGKYLKIPDSIRKISYLMKLNDKYFVFDYPSYNFNYSNHRFRIVCGDNIEEYKIINFQRYRDGGTTYINVIDKNGDKHVFYSPSKFSNLRKESTWDGLALENVNDEEKNKILSLLNLKLKNVSEYIDGNFLDIVQRNDK